MSQYVIKGGTSLKGEVVIGGAKNAALGILAAAVMTDDQVVIENLPDVSDINALLQAIASIGAKVNRIDNNKVAITGGSISNYTVDDTFIRKIRGSYYFLGALLGKYRRARVALPGGCNIGTRPIDQHIKGFKALGATVEIQEGMIEARAEKLVGAHIYFDTVSVGATINVMMAAAMAEGKSTLENVAKEPHIVDVANFLNSMGASIKGAGTDVIRITGVPYLRGCEYMIIPDQIEAGTFMCAAVATKGDVTLKNIIPRHMESISAKLVEMGATIKEDFDSIRVIMDKDPSPTNIKTLPYPGFPTDMQPQMAVTLAKAKGTSIVTESIWENRFKYVDELAKMGTNITVEGNTAIISGVDTLTGANVNAPDLRAGAALVIAGMAAEGYTVVNDIEYIQRGYEAFPEKLCKLGAILEEVEDERDIKKFKLKTG